MTTPPPKRIDALNPTGSPTRAHEVPAMAGGLAVKLTVAQILSLIESGDLPAIQSAGIADEAVTLAKLQHIAEGTILMREAGAGAGDPIAGTPSQLLAAFPGYVLGPRRVYTVSEPWSKPANIRAVFVQVQGAGGGGGYAKGGSSTAAAGSGGSAGGYAEKIILAASLGSTETVTVGAGGTGGVGSTDTASTAGGSSSFGSHVSATGGGFGGIMSASTSVTSANVSNPGVGSGGDINVRGGAGTPGVRQSGTFAVPGNGGGSFFAGGSAGVFNGSVSRAADDRLYGAGGGGGSSLNTTDRNGGDGGPGLVIVWELF